MGYRAIPQPFPIPSKSQLAMRKSWSLAVNINISPKKGGTGKVRKQMFLICGEVGGNVVECEEQNERQIGDQGHPDKTTHLALPG